jgi:DNA-binding MarR family transcriptional regulator
MPILPKNELLSSIKVSRDIYRGKTKEDISLYRVLEHFSLYNRAISVISKDSELSFRDVEIILSAYAIIVKKGFFTGKRLNDRFNLKQGFITNSLIRLNKKGYITRYKTQDHIKEVLGYIITEKGLEVVLKWSNEYKSSGKILSNKLFNSQCYRGLFKQINELYDSID